MPEEQVSTLAVLALGLALSIGTSGCGDSPAYNNVAYPVAVNYETRVDVNPSSPAPAPEPGEWPTAATVDGVYITTARILDRPTEVVGVIDAHEPSGRQAAAFAVIRERAASLGADAVVGVEFHHGEGAGEPTHLSGLAVRYADRPLRGAR